MSKNKCVEPYIHYKLNLKKNYNFNVNKNQRIEQSPSHFVPGLVHHPGLDHVRGRAQHRCHETGAERRHRVADPVVF